MNINKRQLNEFIFLVTTALITFLLSGYFDILEKFVIFSSQHEEFELDELFSTAVVLSIFLIILLIRNNYLLKIEIKNRIAAEQKIKNLADCDPLTDLPNRRLFLRKLDFISKQSKRNKTRQAILFIDIDNFKQVNDNNGHSTGDQLLCQFSQRAKSCIREVDILARISGDEFAIIITDIEKEQNASTIAKKIINIANKEFRIENHRLKISVSIGIAITPTDASDPEELLSLADKAMYSVKQKSKNNFEFFSKEINTKETRKAEIIELIRESIRLKELYLLYQPIMDKDGNIRYLESLTRWNNIHLGEVLPNEFIPIAEMAGFITDISLWVIEENLKQLNRWLADSLSPPVISINISYYDLLNRSFASEVKKLLTEYHIEARMIEFEITENTILSNPQPVIQSLIKINQLGVNLAISSFGSEYSSLSCLCQAPVSKLKIDRIFIEKISDTENIKLIVNTIISLAKSLQLIVVVEGIENQQQFDLIHNSDADLLQGFYFSRPISPEKIKMKLK